MNQPIESQAPAAAPAEHGLGDVSGRKSRSRLWSGLYRATGRLYVLLSHSILGRCAGGYRRVDGVCGGKRRASRPAVSRRRLQVAEALRNHVLSRILRWILQSLYDLPMRFYGLFALVYGLSSSLACLFFYLFGAWIPLTGRPDLLYGVVGVALLLISLPLMVSPYTVRSAVARSLFGSLILEGYLCIPPTSPMDVRRDMRVWLSLSAILSAIGAAFAALYIPPMILPLGILAVILCGTIFAHPEAGALLVSACVPVVWLFPAAISVLMLLSLMTWCGYLLSRLRLERLSRGDILDTVGLLLLLLTLIASVGGVLTSNAPLFDSACHVVCLSVYFPARRLLRTRAYITRALGGMGVVAVLVTLSNLFLQLGDDVLFYVPVAGEAVVEDMLAQVRTAMFAMDTPYRGTVCSLLTVVSFPLLLLMWLRARRPLARFASLLLIGINACLVAVNGSIGTVLCTVAVVLMFCLLADHRALPVLILTLPGTVGALGWYWTWKGAIPVGTLTSLPWMQAGYSDRMDRLWQMVRVHPFGVGFGVEELGVGLFAEVLVSMGWPGLVVLVIFFVLLLQKGATAISHAVTRPDRLMAVGLLCTICGFLFYGAVHGFLAEPRVTLTVTLVAGLLSQYADILFTESDVRRAESAETAKAADRTLRCL